MRRDACLCDKYFIMWVRVHVGATCAESSSAAEALIHISLMQRAKAAAAARQC